MATTEDASAASAQDNGEESGGSRVVLVDDLAGADDYWLTITDAARVTRRQEITIRRWIAAGDLPVRRQRMGLNKRTRHVRASDLARLTPIIDPTAMITGAPANADLLSIPVQHAQLLTAQQFLTQRLTQGEQTLADLTTQRDADHQMLTQQSAQLQVASEATAALRQDIQGELRALREATQIEMEELRQATSALTSLVQRVETALYDVANQLTHERAARESGHADLVAGLTAQVAAVHQIDVVTRQVQTQQAQQAIQQAQTEQEHRTWQHRLAETREQVRAQQRMTTALSDELTTARRAQQDWQRQLSALQDRAAAAHTDLLAQLQAERHRRRALERQMQSRALSAVRRQRVRPVHALTHTDTATDSH